MVKLLSLVCLTVIISSLNVQADYDCRLKTDGFYSDLEFCHIYWRCNYGMSEEYECPAGTAWNHKEGRCDWLENVDCTRDGTLEITEPTTTTESTTTVEEEETLPPQFPDEFADVTDINGAVVFSTTPKPPEIRLAEMKMSNYLEEKNLTDQILELLEENSLNLTGISLRFDNFQGLNLTEIVKQLEDKSANLTAEMALLNQTTEAYNLKLQSFNETEKQAPITEATTTTTTEATTTPRDWDLMCEELPGETGFMPDPTSCNKYVRCNHGKSQRFTCASGTVWDTENSMCLWSESVDCAEREIEEEESEESEEDDEYEYEYYTDQELAEMEAEANETTEKKTTKTTSPEPKEKAEGLVDVTDASDTTSGKKICQSFGSYFVEDSTNCGAYYLCQNGKESKMTCPEKQLFNLETSLCADFQTVFCGMRPVNYADKNQCLSKRDGIYPDLERGCQVFFQCIKQEKVREATCPVPLKFNAITGRCDNPLNILAPCGTYNPNLNGASTLSSCSKVFTTLMAFLIGKLLLA